jgi:hypothetical protein
MNLMAVSFQGVTAATQRFERAAAEVTDAANGRSDRSLESAMVDMIQAETGVRANLTVQQSLASVCDRLLDIRV